MKIKSSKAKGRRLQNWVKDQLHKIFVETTMVPSLAPDDIKSQTMGMPGEDIVLSPRAKIVIPYSFECKNVERLNLWKALEQAKDNSDDRTPVLIMKRNRTKTYAVIEAKKFFELMRG
jgi:hypothetical protein